MKKNILITGVSGHLGSFVLNKISKRNYNVFALDVKKPEKREGGVKYLVADITDKNKLKKYKKVIKKINILIHLAAYVPIERKLDDLEKSISVNLSGTINLVHLLKKKASFIFASTYEIYGIFDDNKIGENQKENVSFYAISKLFAEKYSEVISRKRDINFICLRFASIYGPGEKIKRAIPNFIKSAAGNKEIIIFGDGREKRRYLYIEDAAQAIIKAIKYKKSNIFNISSEDTVSIINLAKLIRGIFKSESKIIFKPRKKEKIDIIFGIKKAKKELKFKPEFNLVRGLKKTIYEYRRH